MESRILFFFAALVACCFADPGDYRDGGYLGSVYPCNLRDYECIGRLLQANSRCRRPVSLNVPSEFVVPLYSYDIPSFNASYTETNLMVRNLNRCSVQELYVRQGRIVMGIDCPDLDLEADRTLIQHRSLRDDAYCRYHFRGQYPMIRITVVFRPGNSELNDANVFTEVLGLPRVSVQSLDEGHSTDTVLSRDLSPLDVFETEAFFSRGVYMSRRVIQSLFCDYGYILYMY